MTNEEFISLHLDDDVARLALRRMPPKIDAPWCLRQISGHQLAKTKLPTWAAIKGLHYPPRLSLEQCSGEATAVYKREVALRLMPTPAGRTLLADLTGGYGVDFSYMAPLFGRALYFEKQEHLCETARHNFPLLGLGNAEVISGDSIEKFGSFQEHCALVFIDPARRDTAGRKTVAIEDCTPDVTTLLPRLLDRCDFVMLKLSPMLDISRALRSLPGVAEVHVVSLRGECKELLIVCTVRTIPLKFFCANLDTSDPTIMVSVDQLRAAPAIGSLAGSLYLYEPNASILKAGAQDCLCSLYGLRKLHPRSNLFVSPEPAPRFPGRTFRIVAHTDFSKRNLKTFLSGMPKANLAIRNFPSTVAELRKRLKLKEGGSDYLFATTLSDGSHALLRCLKV